MAMITDQKNYLRPDVLARIGDLELRARYVVEGMVSGMHRSPYQGYAVEFAQHREYVPGDDLRHLDWRVYGKSDRFYIKQYEEETNLVAHIALDCSRSMRYPEQDLAAGRMTKFDYGATLAASLACLLVHQQDAVGLLLFDDSVQVHLPPQSHLAHLRSVVHHLQQALLERPTDSRAALAQIAGQLRRRSLVVVISDLLGDVEELIRGIDGIRHANHEVVVMHLLDQDEREFPFQDYTLFEGLEDAGVQLLTDPQSLRAGYLAALDRFRRRLRDACAASRVDFVELSTGDALDVGLRGYLAARARWIKAKA